MALTIALRLALGCVYESPFSLSRVLAYPQRSTRPLCVISSRMYIAIGYREFDRTQRSTHTHTHRASHADKQVNTVERKFQNRDMLRLKKTQKKKEAHTSPGRR